MAAEPPLTPEIEGVLSRYLEVQGQLRRLREEREQLRDALLAHVAGLEGRFWFPVVGGETLMVSRRRRVEIDYDEDLLRQRLGERYTRILRPDVRKLRRHLDDVEGALEPVLALIGSPHPDRVRSAIESGEVQSEEFQGAFKKGLKESLTVRRAREDDGGRW